MLNDLLFNHPSRNYQIDLAEKFPRPSVRRSRDRPVIPIPTQPKAQV